MKALPRIMFIALVLLGRGPLPAKASGNLQTSSMPQGIAIPYIGCPSDGQVGPLPAPHASGPILGHHTNLADRLFAYGAARGPQAVIGPSGWHCASVYGSNGTTLVVTPQRITPGEILSSTFKGLDGPAVVLSVSYGGTSGRFKAARLIARAFPQERSFVERDISEGIVPASDFTFGPYPNDRLTRRTDRIVEFSTPPGSEGMGTQSLLLRGSRPIRGLAMLCGGAGSSSLDVVLLTLRLPMEQEDLSSAII